MDPAMNDVTLRQIDSQLFVGGFSSVNARVIVGLALKRRETMTSGDCGEGRGRLRASLSPRARVNVVLEMCETG